MLENLRQNKLLIEKGKEFSIYYFLIGTNHNFNSDIDIGNIAYLYILDHVNLEIKSENGEINTEIKKIQQIVDTPDTNTKSYLLAIKVVSLTQKEVEHPVTKLSQVIDPEIGIGISPPDICNDLLRLLMLYSESWYKLNKQLSIKDENEEFSLIKNEYKKITPSKEGNDMTHNLTTICSLREDQFYLFQKSLTRLNQSLISVDNDMELGVALLVSAIENLSRKYGEVEEVFNEDLEFFSKLKKIFNIEKYSEVLKGEIGDALFSDIGSAYVKLSYLKSKAKFKNFCLKFTSSNLKNEKFEEMLKNLYDLRSKILHAGKILVVNSRNDIILYNLQTKGGNVKNFSDKKGKFAELVRIPSYNDILVILSSILRNFIHYLYSVRELEDDKKLYKKSDTVKRNIVTASINKNVFKPGSLVNLNTDFYKKIDFIELNRIKHKIEETQDFIKEKDIKKALDNLELILTRQDFSTEFYIFRFACYLKIIILHDSGDYEGSLNVFENYKIEEINQENIPFFNNKAYCKAKLNLFSAVIGTYLASGMDGTKKLLKKHFGKAVGRYTINADVKAPIPEQRVYDTALASTLLLGQGQVIENHKLSNEQKEQIFPSLTMAQEMARMVDWKVLRGISEKATDGKSLTLEEFKLWDLCAYAMATPNNLDGMVKTHDEIRQAQIENEVYDLLTHGVYADAQNVVEYKQEWNCKRGESSSYTRHNYIIIDNWLMICKDCGKAILNDPRQSGINLDENKLDTLRKTIELAEKLNGKGKKPYLIYKITFPSGKVYIGQTYRSLDTRFQEHLDNALKNNKNSFLSNAIRKYAEGNTIDEKMQYMKDNNFIELWQVCESQEDADNAETYWIGYYHAQFSEFGYNTIEGGQGVGRERIIIDYKQLDKAIRESIKISKSKSPINYLEKKLGYSYNIIKNSIEYHYIWKEGASIGDSMTYWDVRMQKIQKELIPYLKRGYSPSQIAPNFGVTSQTISNWIEEMYGEGNKWKKTMAIIMPKLIQEKISKGKIKYDDLANEFPGVPPQEKIERWIDRYIDDLTREDLLKLQRDWAIESMRKKEVSSEKEVLLNIGYSESSLKTQSEVNRLFNELFSGINFEGAYKTYITNILT